MKNDHDKQDPVIEQTPVKRKLLPMPTHQEREKKRQELQEPEKAEGSHNSELENVGSIYVLHLHVEIEVENTILIFNWSSVQLHR